MNRDDAIEQLLAYAISAVAHAQATGEMLAAYLDQSLAEGGEEPFSEMFRKRADRLMEMKADELVERNNAFREMLRWLETPPGNPGGTGPTPPTSSPDGDEGEP